MKIRYTYVDALTRVPCTEAPMVNGPDTPAVAGLTFAFAAESEWPTQTPTMYGEAPDGADAAVPGVLAMLTDAEYAAAYESELAAKRAKMVVTPFQAKAALAQAGLLPQVEAIMADPATDVIARLAWQEAIEFRRTSPTLTALAQALQLDDVALDDLFRAAAEITA